MAVLAIDGPDNPPSVFDRNRVESATSILLDVLADALRQFDVRLSGIDVLSVGRRRASRAHHPYAATYTSMIGDHAAMGQAAQLVCTADGSLAERYGHRQP